MSRITLVLASCLTALAFNLVGAAEPEDAAAKEKQVVLKVGDKAPAFVGHTDQDKPWKSADHMGKKVLVVYFYPADLTGGCTKQACNYRDAMAEFKEAGVEVIGVSGDSVENHQKFKKEHKLNFTLLADPEGKIAKAFGVKQGPGGVANVPFGGGKIDLERGVTAMRWTFIIDRDGKIAYKDDDVAFDKDTENTKKIVEKLAKANAEKPKT